MKTLLSEEQLRDGVARMAAEVNAQYGAAPLTIVGVLTGSLVLLADLIRQLRMPLRVDVIQASSYRQGTRPGELLINDAFVPEIAGQHVLLIDDIYDTGRTLAEVIRRMSDFGPTSLRTLVLLRKRARQEVEIQPDFLGFDIPDEFVVGYGLDYQGAYRNLPFLAVLEPDEIAGSST